MMKAISSRQDKAIKDGFLDLLGESKTNYAAVSLDAITDALIYLAAIYVQRSTDKLNQKNKVSSGFLSDSIKAMPVQILGKG